MIVPKLRSPVVLVHGLLGFDRLRLGNWTVLSYFPGIPELLVLAGNRVLEARHHDKPEHGARILFDPTGRQSACPLI